MICQILIHIHIFTCVCICDYSLQIEIQAIASTRCLLAICIQNHLICVDNHSNCMDKELLPCAFLMQKLFLSINKC